MTDKAVSKSLSLKDYFPASAEAFFIKIASLAKFSVKAIRELFRPPYEVSETLRQFFLIGYKTLPLISVTGFIIGLTLTLQSIPTLSKFGASSLVPSMVALAVILEIGPVITSLIFAGKIGSGIGAELGSMKVTEQIDAMEVSGTNPFRYLVVTRVAASTLMLPLLVILADGIALFGGFLAINIFSEMGLKNYLISAMGNLGFKEVLPATFKTFLFGFSVGIVGSFEGFNASRGTESVGIAANTAVVVSSLFVILIDMIMVQLTSIIF